MTEVDEILYLPEQQQVLFIISIHNNQHLVTGLAAAFTAPIGGFLFALEEMASFWPSSLTWATLWTCMIAAFVNAAILGVTNESRKKKKIFIHLLKNFILAVIPFPYADLSNYHYLELIPFAIVGLVGGTLGATFNVVNVKINTWRKSFYVNKKWYYKLTEVKKKKKTNP
jgi:chloride channel 7